MRVNFPGPAPANYSQGFIMQVLSRLTLTFSQVLSSQQEGPCVVLSSPDGKIWRVSVSNAGALVVAPATPTTREHPGTAGSI